jgi:hypothetical protein
MYQSLIFQHNTAREKRELDDYITARRGIQDIFLFFLGFLRKVHRGSLENA